MSHCTNAGSAALARSGKFIPGVLRYDINPHFEIITQYSTNIIKVTHTFTIHNGEEDWSLFDRPIPEDATMHIGWPEDKLLELCLRTDFMCKLCGESLNELELGRHGRER